MSPRTGQLAHRRSLAAGATPTEEQIDAYLTRLLPANDFLRYGMIDIVANLAGRGVTISGEKRGVTPIEALKLKAPATYNIRIEKSGYVPFTTKVELPPDGEIKVEAELSKRGASRLVPALVRARRRRRRGRRRGGDHDLLRDAAPTRPAWQVVGGAIQ